MTSNDATQVVNTAPQLFLIDCDGKEIPVQGEMTVGRSDECDIVVDDPKASRKHARVWPEGEGLSVQDLGSTNGTKHEGVTKERFQLLNGESVSFPNVAYRIKIVLPFATPEIDPDKTMPLDLDTLSPTPSEPVQDASEDDEKNKEQASEGCEKIDSGSSGAAETKGASEPIAQNSGTEQESAKSSPEADNGAWWENAGTKSDGTAVFKIDDAAANKTNVAALVQLGPAVSPRLVIKSGPRAGTAFDLNEGSMVIGKEASCDIQLSDPTVSDQHAKMVHDGHTWQLVNLLALNHTYVNDNKVQSTYLNSGDQIRLGGELLVFQLPEIESDKNVKRSAKTWLVAGIVGGLTIALAVYFLTQNGVV